jgi:peptidoglycan/LPS O-acetylase OafA/YrhL
VTSAGAFKVARLNSLTSLRWAAAFGVFLDHASGLTLPLGRHWGRLSEAGATGVSFFFILSGFVLTWTFRADRPARDFYRRRIARIVPSYLIACLIAIPVTLYLLGGSASVVTGDLVTFTGLQAWVPNSHVYFGGDGVLWSLSAEAFFYLLFPWIAPRLLRLDRTATWRCAFGFIGFIVAVPLIIRAGHSVNGGISYWAIYVLPVYRVGEFLLGIVLCRLVSEGWIRRLTLAGALALAAASIVGAAYAPNWMKWEIVTVVPYSVLIVAAAQKDLDPAAGHRILHSRVLVRLGEWSFAFYLLHQMVIDLVTRIGVDVGLTSGRRLAFAAVALASSIWLAYLLHSRVEVPAERWIRARRPTRPTAGRHAIARN